MMVKDKVIARMNRSRQEFTAERLKVVNRAYQKVMITLDIESLLEDTNDQEVNKMIRVVFHDVTRSTTEKELYRKRREELTGNLKGSLAGKLKGSEYNLEMHLNLGP